MGDHAQALTGPDFRKGVDIDSLAEGVPLLGHADDAPVLVTRFGNDVFAVGASCTHYSGPLAEGLVTGDTVRCPWHHACFSLRNGEALRSPALSPLPSWKVIREGDRILVGEKVERSPLAPTYPARPAKKPANVVIIGAGAAGAAAAEMLRRCGYDGPISMLDSDADAPYDRPNLSKDYLAGSAPEEWIPLRPSGFYEEHDIRVVRDTVTRIDTVARSVTTQSSGTLRFDQLLVATGAEPVALSLPGEDQPHVHYLRSLADSRAIIRDLPDKPNVVVIGSSFIGLEVAAALRTRGHEVHVVAPETIPLERVLGRDLGEFIRELHTEKGVQFHLGRKPASIGADSVTLDDGTVLRADLVVMGVGVRPRIQLGADAGLAVDRGIVVDRHLETNVAGIYAAGDIARFPDALTGEAIRIEHWVVAQRMGQLAARNMLGARESFTDAPFFWSAHYDVSINYVGHAERIERLKADGSTAERDYAARIEGADGRLLALATIFRDGASLEAEVQMERAAADRLGA